MSAMRDPPVKSAKLPAAFLGALALCAACAALGWPCLAVGFGALAGVALVANGIELWRGRRG